VLGPILSTAALVRLIVEDGLQGKLFADDRCSDRFHPVTPARILVSQAGGALWLPSNRLQLNTMQQETSALVRYCTTSGAAIIYHTHRYVPDHTG